MRLPTKPNNTVSPLAWIFSRDGTQPNALSGMSAEKMEIFKTTRERKRE